MMSLEDMNRESVTDKIQYGTLRDEKVPELDEVHKLALEQQVLLDKQKQTYTELLLSNNSTRKVNIPQVVVNNSQFYRTSFLNKQLEPLLGDGKDAPSITVGDLPRRIDAVTKNLVNSTSTENLFVNLEALPQQLQHFSFLDPAAGANDSSISLVPVFNLLPVKRFFAKTGTTVGSGEGNGYISFQLRNILKGGENLIFDATVGTRTRTSYLLNLNFPVNNNAFLRLENLFFMNSKTVEWASHDETVRGFANKLIKYGIGNINNPETFYENFTQELSFENVWRTVAVLDSAASDHVLMNCGDDFKSSFVYNIKYDNRKNKVLPKDGQMFKFQVEYAPSFLSNFQKANFLKYSAESSISTPLTDNIFSSLSLKTGFLQSLSPISGLTSIMDKFYLGGPTDVRGFSYNGLGPVAQTSPFNKNHSTTGGDRLGGDFFYSAGLSVFSTIPKLAPTPDYNFKLHTFLNAGKLINLSQSKKPLNDIFSLVKQPSVSAGVGILYNHPAARFELNFTLPILASQSDALRKGIQYGIGVSFL